MHRASVLAAAALTLTNPSSRTSRSSVASQTAKTPDNHHYHHLSTTSIDTPSVFFSRFPQNTNDMSAPRPTSPANNAASGSTTARPASPKPPGGPATVMRRKAAADRAEKVSNQRPSSTRAAGAGGSSSTMLRLYTDESPGLKVDPVVVMTLSVVFIFSVVALHVMAKVARRFTS
ncbi:hypothetical protein E8E13_004572 [Curvularia kusanoi]|uniref:Protein transport protein Sec61 subunit beta n=1 Tax=Curvularia kusanoi TaxID=90978 RepID=A0A9P4W2X1_CURKU|nr:hypothetical protein E8E13_004572 [Curvularia kusanoi]